MLDLDAFKVVAQVDGVFLDDEFELDVPKNQLTAFPLDAYGVMHPETSPGHVGLVELTPRQSVLVTADGRTVAGLETLRPETAMALRSMVREATAMDYDAKAENAGSDALRVENQAVAGSIRDGSSIKEALNLGVEVRSAQTFQGDARNADALIADSRDNGLIDGSNLPEVTIGDRSYAVSAGGGVMHGRTTMTPAEIAARAANGGDVTADAVAKARAEAMGQSLHDGFSAKDQIAVDEGRPAAPGELAASVRSDLEAMADSEYGLALDARERQALEDMIDEAQEIEEAARFNGAMGLADNEYALAMQMQERQALDDMIAKAKEMDVLADLPIPAFKPDLAFPAPPRPDDGPDMRGGDVAFGRGTVENGPGGKNVAYDGFDDWAADMRDMVNGNGPKEGVATPNEAETERQEAEKKEAEKKEEAETTNVGLKHEGGQNQGQQSDSVSNAGNNYGAPGDGIY